MTKITSAARRTDVATKLIADILFTRAKRHPLWAIPNSQQ
jgi:hypothetical protein